MLYTKTSTPTLSPRSAAALKKATNEAIAAAARMAAIRAAEPTYTLRGSNYEIYHAKEPEVIAVGPAGTGKTLAILLHFHHMLWTYPGAVVFLIRKTRASLTDSVLATYERDVLGEGHPILGNVQRENRHVYRYPNGSQMVVFGLDKPTRLMSTEPDGIALFEAIECTQHEIESITVRLGRGKAVPPAQQQLIMDTNPDVPTHHLKTSIDAGTYRHIPTRHEDNPRLFNFETGEWTELGKLYLARLSRQTGVRLARYKLGLWTSAEGVVYDAYDPTVHCVPDFPIPGSWRRIRAIDFGFRNPFVCLWLAVSPDNVAYVYRQLYLTGQLVEDMAFEILRLEAGKSKEQWSAIRRDAGRDEVATCRRLAAEGERIEATLADHDAEGVATLHKYGVQTRPADKAILEGIELVKKRFEFDAVRRTEPGLRVFTGSLVSKDPALYDDLTGRYIGSTCLQDELVAYVWTKTPDGRLNKELPLDMDNHACDALRYAMKYIDAAAAVRIDFVRKRKRKVAANTLWETNL